MAQKIRDKGRDVVLRHVEEPGARFLNWLGFSPNMITVFGFIVVIGSAAAISLGHLTYGGVIFLAGSFLDMFDGSLARLTNRVTLFGGVLDSLFDRLGEMVLYLGLAMYGVRINPGERDLVLYFALLIIALGASQCVSYLRAKGEALNIYTRGGLMTRPERVILLSLGLLLGDGIMVWILGVIAVLSIWTLYTRVVIIRQEIHGSE
ncbi:CDP-alcohol phosphatidyltransferase family protein [SAR202 cluster bacterium AD-804-J14_MRT_500m]|nr:CDP-alcohol phosphatidyltransferase family protein [SAR202 cluster bacterium AD-804-J14_MRT_500m]